jgi:LacI family transcriptional regulator
MRDVAAKAGVSPMVVSHVLHKKAATVRVREDTAERVRRAAEELGYRCNILARNFRSQQTHAIAAMHGTGFERPVFSEGSRYFAALMDGIVKGAFSYGYSVSMCPQLLGNKPTEAMADGRFDGLVWYSTLDSESDLQMLLGCNVPVVLVHAHASDFNNAIPTVICDNYQGIGLAVEHLVELGHRRIGFALKPGDQYSERAQRLAAFQSHMQRLGLPLSERDVVHIDHELTALDAYMLRKPLHTALIANNDAIAMEIMGRAQKYGISVPYDLSVVGFDSTSYCEELRPTLTSIRQPLKELGQSAIDLLMLRIRGEDCDPPEIVIPCSLDVRGSTAPPLVFE